MQVSDSMNFYQPGGIFPLSTLLNMRFNFQSVASNAPKASIEQSGMLGQGVYNLEDRLGTAVP